MATLKDKVSELEAENKSLLEEVAALKLAADDKSLRFRLSGLREFLEKLYKQSDDIKLRSRLSSWMKQL